MQHRHHPARDQLLSRRRKTYGPFFRRLPHYRHDVAERFQPLRPLFGPTPVRRELMERDRLMRDALSAEEDEMTRRARRMRYAYTTTPPPIPGTTDGVHPVSMHVLNEELCRIGFPEVNVRYWGRWDKIWVIYEYDRRVQLLKIVNILRIRVKLDCAMHILPFLT
jgi:hypothetical protein